MAENEHSVVKCSDIEPREAFCYTCGFLGVWTRREDPTACDACGAAGPFVGLAGSGSMSVMAARWHEASVIRELAKIPASVLESWWMAGRGPLHGVAVSELKRRNAQQRAEHRAIEAIHARRQGRSNGR